jgi:hypothetical protein
LLAVLAIIVAPTNHDGEKAELAFHVLPPINIFISKKNVS